MLEWGADVVKVELPGFGDQARWLPISRDDRRSAWFTAFNRGKRSVTVDLRVPEGREVFLRLVERADVVISNFKPGTMEGWGLGYGEVSTCNPRIVYATGSSFGSRGPDAQREGADLSAQAAGGIISTTGGGGSDPSSIGATIADHIAGQNLLAGILAALFERERTGRGQEVETSLLGGQVWAQAGEYTHYLMSGEISGPGGRSHPMIPGIYGMFPTSDGWIAIVGVAGPARDLFYRTIGRPDLIDRFDHLLYFENDKAELWPILERGVRVEDHGGVVRPARGGGAALRPGPGPPPGGVPILACRPTATSPLWTAPTPTSSGHRSVSRIPWHPCEARCPSWDSTRRRCCSRTASPGRRSGRSRRSAPSEVAFGPGLLVETCPEDRRTSSVWALPVDLAHRGIPASKYS